MKTSLYLDAINGHLKLFPIVLQLIDMMLISGILNKCFGN